MDAGCKIIECGHFCLSKKRRNSVKGNVLHAAAFFGKNEMLKYLLAHPEMKQYIDSLAVENQDIRPIKAGAYQPEFLGYTPLMLAVISPHSDVETIQILLSN